MTSDERRGLFLSLTVCLTNDCFHYGIESKQYCSSHYYSHREWLTFKIISKKVRNLMWCTFTRNWISEEHKYFKLWLQSSRCWTPIAIIQVACVNQHLLCWEGSHARLRQISPKGTERDGVWGFAATKHDGVCHSTYSYGFGEGIKRASFPMLNIWCSRGFQAKQYQQF